MKIEKEYEAFVIGVVLYAFQASQSIVRAAPLQLDDLREYYAERPKPRELASKIWNYAIQRKIAKRRFPGRIFHIETETDDLYMLSRLLLDFSYLLDGNMPVSDMGNLWYCLALTENKLMNRIANFPIKLAGKLNIFSYPDHLPKPIEIEDIVGESWHAINF